MVETHYQNVRVKSWFWVDQFSLWTFNFYYFLLFKQNVLTKKFLVQSLCFMDKKFVYNTSFANCFNIPFSHQLCFFYHESSNILIKSWCIIYIILKNKTPNRNLLWHERWFKFYLSHTLDKENFGTFGKVQLSTLRLN